MRLMTAEELEKSKERVRKMDRKFERKMKIFSIIRKIFFTPLAFFFSLVSFVSKGAGYLSTIGFAAAGGYLYDGFSYLSKGIPLSQIDSFKKAIPYALVPFFIFAVSVLTEKFSMYCRIKSL